MGFATVDSEGNTNHHINTRLYSICLSFSFLMVYHLTKQKNTIDIKEAATDCIPTGLCPLQIPQTICYSLLAKQCCVKVYQN